MNRNALKKILRGYDPSFDLDAAMKESSSDEVASLLEWAKVHLSRDNLLSPDEISQYNALQKAGRADILASSTDLTAVQGLSERELRDAIDDLDKATQTVLKQAESLRLQQDALDRWVKESHNLWDTRAEMEGRQARALEDALEGAVAETEDMCLMLSARLAELEQQNKSSCESYQRATEDALRSDDKMLASLQKLGWDLQMEDPEEREKTETMRDMCARLIKCNVETIRTKLDRIFLEAFESARHATADGKALPAPEGELVELEEELESLYSEVLPVAQMAVEQQFLEPTLKRITAKNGISIVRSELAVVYVRDCLDYLLDRTARLSGRIEESQAHQAAAYVLIGTAKAELAVQVGFSKAKEGRTDLSAAPARGPIPSDLDLGVSPVRPQHSSSITMDETSPVHLLLRHLGLSLHDDLPAYLSRVLADRRANTADVARNVEQSFEDMAATQLGDSKLALQMVRDAVLAESPFGEVKLVDPGIEASIDVLAQELEGVEMRLLRVGGDLGRARGRSVKKEEIITRWGDR